MAINSDFRDLFAALYDADARFIVVGAYAVVHYTEPRYTKDLDIWVDRSPQNAARVFQALIRFGAPTDSVTVADFQNPEVIYQIGVEPNRIDILMSIDGTEFSEAFERATQSTYGSTPIRILGLVDLMAAKLAAGRSQDLLDLKRLEEANRRS